MVFFDFVFYLLARTYQNFNEKGFETTAAGVLGLFWTFNVMTVIMIIAVITNNYFLDALTAVGILVILQIISYVRYIFKENHSVEVVARAWTELSASQRQLLKIFALSYSILSLVSCIGVAIYSGSLPKDL